MEATKIAWSGVVVGVQPRIRLTRSFDQRTHSYLGYVLRMQGSVGDDQREFIVAIGEAAQIKHRFRTGDAVRGVAAPVAEPNLEIADLYKAAQIDPFGRGSETPSTSPPWLGIPVPLSVYRDRGHRRLDVRTYDSRCSTCIWGCRMAVEMIIDHWNPGHRRYRQETFCYGPLSCPIYRAGPTRKVPGRKGMTYEEENWVDEQELSDRGPDE